jgi:acyl-coenzyme A thioesterase PaaI-like protein
MKTSFVRPAEGELRALGKLLHRTATLAFCEASVLDDEGHLCAHATGTFKYLRALPTSKSKGGLKGPRSSSKPSE